MQYLKADSRSIPVIILSALKTRLLNYLISDNDDHPRDQSVITSLPFKSFGGNTQTFSSNQQSAASNQQSNRLAI